MEKQKKLLTLGAGMASMAAIVGGSVFMSQGSSASAASGDSIGAYAGLFTAADVAANEDHAAEHAAYITALASKLGISESQLTAAFKSVQLDQVAKALADGKITQAQADEMTTRINSGDAPIFGFGGPGHPGGGPRDGGPGGAHVDAAALATFLGLDEATLQTDLRGGKSLATVATEHGKSRDQLKAFLTSQLKGTLDKGVAAGKLTQAQADAKLAEATTSMDARIDQVGPQGGPRHDRQGVSPTSGSTSPTQRFVPGA
ncbi:MAG: hypothetical protein ABIP13_04755 [Tepidiformaceae bacterium]